MRVRSSDTRVTERVTDSVPVVGVLFLGFESAEVSARLSSSETDECRERTGSVVANALLQTL